MCTTCGCGHDDVAIDGKPAGQHEHAHPHEQISYCVAGRFEYLLDGQVRVTPWGVLLLRGPSLLANPRSTLVPPRGYYRFVTPKEPDTRTGGGSD